MIKFFKRSLTWTLSIITVLFAFVPESCFKVLKMLKSASVEANVIINRSLVFLLVFIVVIIGQFILCHFKNSIKIKGHGYCLQVEYGDIFKKDNCKKVINFDECFTTSVGDVPSKIKPTSVCGQYLMANPIHNMQALLEDAHLKPAKSKSRYQMKTRYESGKLVPNGDDLLMAFAKLDEDGRARFFSRDEYLNCLSILWNEIDKYYGQKDVCIPILGSGITRFEDKMLTQQELLDIIVASYKLSPYKLKPPCQLHIMCQKTDDFSLNRIGETL